MKHKEFTSFKTPELAYIEEITPILFLDPSHELSTTVVYVIHSSDYLIALGVDIEEATDPFYIDESIQDKSSTCDLCGDGETRLILELASLTSDIYSVDSFKGDGLRLDEDNIEFGDITKKNVCEECYNPVINRLSEWMRKNSTELASHII